MLAQFCRSPFRRSSFASLIWLLLLLRNLCHLSLLTYFISVVQPILFWCRDLGIAVASLKSLLIFKLLLSIISDIFFLPALYSHRLTLSLILLLNTWFSSTVRVHWGILRLFGITCWATFFLFQTLLLLKLSRVYFAAAIDITHCKIIILWIKINNLRNNDYLKVMKRWF